MSRVKVPVNFQVTVEEVLWRPPAHRWHAQFSIYPHGFFRGSGRTPGAALSKAWRVFEAEFCPGQRWWSLVMGTRLSLPRRTIKSAPGQTRLLIKSTLQGQDIRRFTALQVVHGFEGLIGGPPCQDFSGARRRPPTGYGLEMLNEFRRVVTEAQPDWWLMENVPRVPDMIIPQYVTQRFNLFAAEFGLRQLRNRSFQFGQRDGLKLVIQRGKRSQRLLKGAAMASDGKSRRRCRTFADLCELQGLPRAFTLYGFSRRAQFRLIGNGVPLPVGKAVAEAIRDRRVTHGLKVCACDCGRPVTGKQIAATAACRKRLERARRSHTEAEKPPPSIQPMPAKAPYRSNGEAVERDFCLDPAV